MTTFKELLRQAKSEPKGKLIPRPINLELQKSIDELNEMFAENWTTLFDENKEYPMWNDGILIYFGQGMNDYFRVEQTPINKIVLVKCPASNRVTYPYTITKSYNKILLMIITLHMYKDFKKEVDFCEMNSF